MRIRAYVQPFYPFIIHSMKIVKNKVKAFPNLLT